ncbi:DUF234 domain-containing protein [Candidatus Marinarcus aquaticus]|nr:DUF234 domain-containing protein [Candidatus Marinarcus aquaticus]
MHKYNKLQRKTYLCYNIKYLNKGYIIKFHTLPIEEQFKLFCEQNRPKDMEQAIAYFTVFGGTDVVLDMNLPLTTLIETHILNQYKFLRNDISKLTDGDALLHSILSACALSDRRTNAAFKRANVSFNEGIDCVDELCDMKLLTLETTVRLHPNQFDDENVSEKVLFVSPFLRFWFAFISPLFKGIKEGDYSEFYERFKNREQEFSDLIFEQLCHAYIKNCFTQESIKKTKRYWDDEYELDLYAKTQSGRIVIGSCKYRDSKVSKKELTRLHEVCEDLDFTPDITVLFAKKGFSSELKSLKGEHLKLFTTKSLKALLS